MGSLSDGWLGRSRRAASSAALTLAIAVAGCAGQSAAGNTASGAGSVATQSVGVGAPATDFTLRDLKGENVRLSDFLGKQVVLIDFWATWCVPCQAEMPHLQSLYQAHRARGFVVLGVAMDGPETIAQVGSFARRYDLQFPILLDEETKVVGVYNPKRTAPLSILIDRQGQIVRYRSGFSAGDEKLIAADVASLVGP